MRNAGPKTFDYFGADVPLEDMRVQIGKGDRILRGLIPPDLLARQGEAIQACRSELFRRDYLARARPFSGVRALFEHIKAVGQKAVLASSGTAAEVDPVPPELSTLDPLSALVKLARVVGTTGRCDGTAAVFDGRRRTDAVARTVSHDLLPPRRWSGEAWSGEALRCGLEWRQLAGFQPHQDRQERGRVNTGSAWIAPAWAGGPPIPVRAELPIRWLGTLHFYLVHAAPARERALPNQHAPQPHRSLGDGRAASL